MTTLLEYTRTEFPNHTVEVRYPDGRRVALSPDEDATPATTTTAATGSRPIDAGSRQRPTRPPERPDRPDRPDVEGRSATQRRSVEALAALDLVEHTVVAHVVGADATVALLDLMHDAGWERSIAILVEPEAPRVVGRGRENSESVTDLPDRRIAVSAAVGSRDRHRRGGTARVADR